MKPRKGHRRAPLSSEEGALRIFHNIASSSDLAVTVSKLDLGLRRVVSDGVLIIHLSILICILPRWMQVHCAPNLRFVFVCLCMGLSVFFSALFFSCVIFLSVFLGWAAR